MIFREVTVFFVRLDFVKKSFLYNFGLQNKVITRKISRKTLTKIIIKLKIGNPMIMD
jgi:hypothetical protein